MAFFERGFPLIGKVQPILDWFAGERAATATAAADAGAETVAESGKLGDLDEETRRAIYLETKLAREQAWEEAEIQFPLDAPVWTSANRSAPRASWRYSWKRNTSPALPKRMSLSASELTDIEAEGDQAEWPGRNSSLNSAAGRFDPALCGFAIPATTRHSGSPITTSCQLNSRRPL